MFLIQKFLKIFLLPIIVLSFVCITNPVLADKYNYDANVHNQVDFNPYMRELQRNIKINWHPPKREHPNTVVLLFKIAKDGSLLSSKIIKSSDDDEVDKSALAALNKAAPFKPLPSEFSGKNVDIQFTFDYKIINGRPPANTNEQDYKPHNTMMDEDSSTDKSTLDNIIAKIENWLDTIQKDGDISEKWNGKLDELDKALYINFKKFIDNHAGRIFLILLILVVAILYRRNDRL